MGRTYAGILGLLAFGTVVVQGLLHGGGMRETVERACLCLFGFALVGFLVGQLADWLISEGIREQLAEAAADTKPSTTALKDRGPTAEE